MAQKRNNTNKKANKKPSSTPSNKKKTRKYIFVIGGVMSGVGKGITTSSIGTILEAKGLRVNIVKVDPYLNVDAGTMNPTEHGEVFVMESGLETDQDMGNYERFLGRTARTEDYMTSGMIYQHVIAKERALGYGGRCVEAIPDIRDEIIHRFELSAQVNNSDVSVIEIGGTVGDYQNIMFIEAARVMKIRHPKDVVFMLVSYMPIPNKIGEMKSKPTQNAIRQLSSYGVHTDFIIARSELPLDKKRKEKIAISCSVPAENVISAPDIDSIYDVPVNFEKDRLGEMLIDSLGLKNGSKIDLSAWKAFLKRSKNQQKQAKIAVVGKYFDSGDFVLSDAYISVIEAIKFSAYQLGAKPVISWVNAKDFEGSPAKVSKKLKELSQYDGILVPGGFGESGIEGKLKVIEYARTRKIPYLGLCYGMQLLVIEYARNVLKWKDAHTAEINPKASKVVIDIMPEQKELIAQGKYGGSMRLGSYLCVLKEDSVAAKAYQAFGGVSVERAPHIFDKAKDSLEAYLQRKVKGDMAKGLVVGERHRHRYEVNPEYVQEISDKGLVFSGTSPDETLMEIAELPESKHPFFVGAQFHPEFLARPLSPHPLFSAFIKASLKHLS